jgi:primosomal protein N' (replication factor Y)
MDSMRRRGAYQDAWRRIIHHEVDIIFGTQMIAKGLHVESVTLAGVISADFALALPDFRSAERTYALVTQVAGRAGRGQKPGEVILQTFMPHHYALDCAARLAEQEFHDKELHIRRMLRFPPFARLAGLILSSPDQEQVRDQAERLASILKTLAYRQTFKTIQVLGATPAPISKLEDHYRWRILLRGAQARPLHDLLHEGLAQFEKVHKKSCVNLTIDIDALDFL